MNRGTRPPKVAPAPNKQLGPGTVKGTYVRACRAVFKDWTDADFYGPKATHLFFYGHVSEKTVQDFRKELYDANKPRVSNTNVKSKPKPIVVHLHSPGGDGYLGITLANFLRECSVPVAIVVDGYACSAVTPMLVSGAYRVVHDFSFVMFHEGSLSMYGTEKMGQVKFIVNKAVEGLVAEYTKLYKGNTKVPKDVLDNMLHRDLYMDAATCIKYGVADRLIHITQERSAEMWKGYIAQNPDFAVPDDPLRWSTGLNHLYNYNNGVTKMETGDEIMQAILNAVRPMQAIMVDASGAAAKPVVLHTNMYTTPYQARWMDVAPLLIRVFLLPAPVVGVIDSDIDLLQALPCIMAHKRYMYSNTAIYVTLQHYHEGSRTTYYHDIKANTDMLRGVMKSLLKAFAPRFPEDKLNKLFEDRVRLSAEECKAYGLVDDVIVPFMRDMDDGEGDGAIGGRKRTSGQKKTVVVRRKRQGGQSGGCACSQGLPIEYIDH